MKLRKRLSTVVVSILCLSMLCSIGASAAGDAEYDSKVSTFSEAGYNYKAWSTLYVGSGYRAATYIQVTNGNAPAGYMQYQARLYDMNGDELRTSQTRTNASATNLDVVTTTSAPADAAYSRGWVAVKDSQGNYVVKNLNATETIARGRSAAETDIVDALKDTLDTDGQYPVNQNGESYGSALLSDIVGEEPDLIAAVGVDGVRGYIRPEESHAIYNVPIDQDVPIPLYDVNGNVIGTYLLYGIDVEFTEALKADSSSALYKLTYGG